MCWERLVRDQYVSCKAVGMAVIKEDGEDKPRIPPAQAFPPQEAKQP